MAQGPEIDPVTGTQTTGHIWDGIQELNTPLPRWWLWLFYITIVWAIGYWVVYPAWPLVSSYSRGMFGWQSREAIVEDLQLSPRGIASQRHLWNMTIRAATPGTRPSSRSPRRS